MGRQRCHQGMADFVIGDQSLFGSVLKRCSRQTHGDALKRLLQLPVAQKGNVMPRREDRSLIEKIGQISTRKAWSASGPVSQ